MTPRQCDGANYLLCVCLSYELKKTTYNTPLNRYDEMGASGSSVWAVTENPPSSNI